MLELPQFDAGLSGLFNALAAKGLLDSTSVFVTGEFGRTPKINPRAGRDHYPRAMFCLLAGGGIKGGITHGASDDYGYSVATDGVHVHDLNATLMWQLGIDHMRLTYKYQGRNFRLTDVRGEVIKQILA